MSSLFNLLQRQNPSPFPMKKICHHALLILVNYSLTGQVWFSMTVEIVTAGCTHCPSKYNIMVITSVPLTMDVATRNCHAHPWMNKCASNHNHLQGIAFQYHYYYSVCSVSLSVIMVTTHLRHTVCYNITSIMETLRFPSIIMLWLFKVVPTQGHQSSSTLITLKWLLQNLFQSSYCQAGGCKSLVTGSSTKTQYHISAIPN